MRCVFFLVLILLLVSPVIILGQGQGTSGVTGVVSDSNGAIVSGAKVTLTDTKTSRELTTTTNDQGSFSFNDVQPGERYRLTFTAQGFKTTVLNAVTLGAAKTETYNAVLSTGDVSATVDVLRAAREIQ